MATEDKYFMLEWLIIPKMASGISRCKENFRTKSKLKTELVFSKQSLFFIQVIFNTCHKIRN